MSQVAPPEKLSGTATAAGRELGRLGVVVVLAVLDEAVLGVEADAFEVLLHDEVDDAGEGVRTVHGRGAAGDHFDVVDQGGGDGVQVGDRQGRVGGHQALAVDQHQGALRAEAAQVDRRRARGAVGGGRGEVGEGLRQVVDQGFDIGRALQLGFLVTDDGDREVEVRFGCGMREPVTTNSSTWPP